MKDLFEVAGFAVGAGVPAYLAESRPAATSASAVEALVAAGADVIGIAQTDEFAYSVAGRNSHYGTPPNVAAPGSIPGGSSSGPASAVALGQVSIGLGTDTAGSIRVPASYQGLWGLRTSHGAIDTAVAPFGTELRHCRLAYQKLRDTSPGRGDLARQLPPGRHPR